MHIIRGPLAPKNMHLGHTPPPPHDPTERGLVAQLGVWQVRDFGEGDARAPYLARHGMLHVQLWHPDAGVSVLTPSRLTLGRWEVFPFRGWKLRHPWLRLVQDAVAVEHRVALPSQTELRSVVTWFVEGRERRLAPPRTPQAAASRPASSSLSISSAVSLSAERPPK